MVVQGNKALGGDGGGRFDEVAFIDVEVGVEDGRIHDYGACQGANRTPDARFLQDDTPYPEPPELTLHLSHKDVWLDFSKDRKQDIFRLRSGNPLAYDDGDLVSATGVRVARLSKAALAEIRKREAQGYAVREAHVGFIVAWKAKDATEESAILLPVLTLRRT